MIFKENADTFHELNHMYLRISVEYYLLCESFYKFLSVIALAFKLLYVPARNVLHRIFERSCVKFVVLENFYAVLFLPACHDSIVSAAVYITLVVNGFLSCFIHNFLLCRCKAVVDFLVDAEEKAVVVCSPK